MAQVTVHHDYLVSALSKAALSIADLLNKLEAFHGHQEPLWPTDPYLFLVWWHCGYPASDQACAKGWESLKREIGVEPQKLLAATPAKLASALTPGGTMPEIRAMRLKEIAARIKDEFGGDLRPSLVGPVSEIRKTLKEFPSIADPGADRILLFGRIAAVAAVPSNCAHVLLRILRGDQSENYQTIYKEAQRALQAEVAATFEARSRAYLLLKRHGQEICKRSKPKCGQCPVSSSCAFFADNRRRWRKSRD